MQTEWFQIAENLDRLKGKALGPVGETIKCLACHARSYLLAAQHFVAKRLSMAELITYNHRA